jgi:hypothetical protein
LRHCHAATQSGAGVCLSLFLSPPTLYLISALWLVVCACSNNQLVRPRHSFLSALECGLVRPPPARSTTTATFSSSASTCLLLPAPLLPLSSPLPLIDIDRQTDMRETDKRTCDRQDRQQTDRQIDRQTGRQTD